MVEFPSKNGSWKCITHPILNIWNGISVATAGLKTTSWLHWAKNEASHSHNYDWVVKAMKPQLELWLGPKMETLARKQHPGSSSRWRHLILWYGAKFTSCDLNDISPKQYYFCIAFYQHLQVEYILNMLLEYLYVPCITILNSALVQEGKL